MLLVIDVGNTNLTFGIFESTKLKTLFRMTTQVARTSDEFGADILGILHNQNFDRKMIDAVIIASVVPQVMHSLVNGIKKYFKLDPMIVGMGTKTGIRILSGNASEIGADRIVDAVGGLMIYGGPILVIDFGTATTYDLIGEDGSFLSGITCPGMKLSANALWTGTAKLPEIEIAKPASILAKNTVTSMQSGIFFGTVGQTEYIIEHVKKEAGLKEMKVVATGGLGRIIADETDMIQVYDPDLTLQGLRLIYEANRKKV